MLQKYEIKPADAISTLCALNAFHCKAIIEARDNFILDVNPEDFLATPWFNTQLHVECFINRVLSLGEKPLTTLFVMSKMDQESMKASLQMHGKVEKESELIVSTLEELQPVLTIRL